MDEIELKFLNITVEETKKKLEEIGAKLIFDTHMKSMPLQKEGYSSWDSTKKYLRVRQIGEDIRVTFKEPMREESKMSSTEETEIQVDNFENALLLFEQLGFTRGEIYTKHRLHYELGEMHFEIDDNGQVPTYLEIETQTEEAMHEACKKMGLDVTKGKKGTIVEIYPDVYHK